MTCLLAIDPSLSSCGCAIFHGPTLVRWARVTREVTTETPAVRAVAIARRILEWSAATMSRIDAVAHEWPQIYRAAKSAGDPNDLVAMAAVVAAVVVVLPPPIAHLAYTPAEWIGQLPKTMRVVGGRKRRKPRKGEEWETPRGRLIAKVLTPAERAIAEGANHDAIDAIGIGLHALGRLRAAMRVFPGATPG